MKYNELKEIIENFILDSNEYKIKLIKKIINQSKRYIGIFRASTPKTKLIQNITQSNEIQFGNALEKIFQNYFEIEMGFKLKNKNEYKNMDQLIFKNDQLILIEQKVRDDHDSSKKKGQLKNLIEKCDALKNDPQFSKLKIFCWIWFIDESFKKNKKWLSKEIEEIKKKSNIEFEIFYGKNLFEKLGYKKLWKEFEKNLTKWKKTLNDLPKLNLENNSDNEKIVDDILLKISKKNLIKLFSNIFIKEEILPIIFEKNKIPKLIHKRIINLKDKNSIELKNIIEKYLNKN